MKRISLFSPLHLEGLLVLTLFVFLFSGKGTAQSVLISEVADPGDEFDARFVELYNPTSNPVDISGWELKLYSNGNNSENCTEAIPASTSIPAGGTYVIAKDLSVFDTEYSCSADLESGCINSNGDDVYELLDDAGNRVDIHGEVGVDGTGEPWEFEDAIAQRNSDVCSGNTSYDNSEWTYIDPGNTGDATPCTHSATCGCSHSISGFTPEEACPDSGDLMTINGSGFNDGTGTSDVIIGGDTIPSSDITVVSDSEIEVVLDSAASGFVEVVTDGCAESSSETFTASCPECAELFLNEFSNGDQGVREYAEFVVGNSCGECNSDLTGWIIDDNNGTFSGGASTGKGIAQGHMRFADVAAWENIPTGSIILIYNDDDPNNTVSTNLADDPYDGDGDSVYVIPASNADLEECEDIPNSSDGGYSPCSYSGTSDWGPIGMSNSQDAMQSRYPDANYFHGASYGSDGDFDGGPDGLHVHNSGGSGDVFYFDGTDPRAVGDWTTGSATDDVSTTDETPGAPNSTANENWIDGLKCSVLPIDLLRFEGVAVEEGNRVEWVTAAEEHHDRYVLQKRVDGGSFEDLEELKGKGGQANVNRYRVLDKDPSSLTYYRLKSIDRDGTVDRFGAIAVRREEKGFELRKSGADRYQVNLPSDEKGELHLIDLQGRTVRTFRTKGREQMHLRLDEQPDGLYILQYRTSRGTSHSERLVK